MDMNLSILMVKQRTYMYMHYNADWSAQMT